MGTGRWERLGCRRRGGQVQGCLELGEGPERRLLGEEPQAAGAGEETSHPLGQTRGQDLGVLRARSVREGAAGM